MIRKISLFLFGFGSLLWTMSCADEAIVPFEELIAGKVEKTWKLTGMLVNDSIDFSAVFLDSCNADNTITFRRDWTSTVDFGNVKCKYQMADSSVSGYWAMNVEETILILNAETEMIFTNLLNDFMLMVMT